MQTWQNAHAHIQTHTHRHKQTHAKKGQERAITHDMDSLEGERNERHNKRVVGVQRQEMNPKEKRNT